MYIVTVYRTLPFNCINQQVLQKKDNRGDDRILGIEEFDVDDNDQGDDDLTLLDPMPMTSEEDKAYGAAISEAEIKKA